MQDTMFVLDIGTRFVRGLICERLADDGGRDLEKPGIRILECEIREHKGRAMLAGQIHDIEEVSLLVGEIRQRLEQTLSQKTGSEVKLSKAAVAVAGRNLLTRQGIACVSRSSLLPVTADEIRQAELLAVQKALESVSADIEYYCVGYSASGYRLDGEEIMNLIGHRGFTLEASVLVTLLPRQVLEAMFEVAKKAGLEIDYLTLEPIAALEASVTEQMKPLSLILIDIGAGTSDIAVVSRGKIFSYGMVPVAGDSVTESVVSGHIVDFATAERLKREGSQPDRTLEFHDIFSRSHTISSGEFLDRLRPAVTALACRLAEEIRAISGSSGFSDFAIILVGGGSLTPFLEQELAAATGLPPGRIGSRPVYLNAMVDDTTGRLKDAAAATAAGIGLMYATRTGLSLTHLTVNDTRATVVSSEKNPTVLSALLSNGITVKQIYGRPGLAKTFTLNGEFRTLKGEAPAPATIELSGAKLSLDAPVHEGDKLVFYPASEGKDADKKISDVLPLPKIIFNGQEIKMPARVLVNGLEADMNAPLEDRADVRYTAIQELSAILAELKVFPESLAQREISVNVDGELRALKSNRHNLNLNGQPADLDRQITIKENDEIEFTALDPEWKVSDVTVGPCRGKDLRVKLNGEEFIFPGGKGKILKNGEETGLDSVLNDGDSVRVINGKDAEAVLVDVFKYLAIEPKDGIGKKIKLLIDGRESQYTSLLHENAEVKVYFE
jgi:cell division protein FtsA